MAYTILVKRGTTASFAALNRVYSNGEILAELGVDGLYRLKIGDGVTAYNSIAYVVGGEGSGSAPGFGTIAVPGQSNVVADSPGDTATLIGSSGIALTTSAGTDTLTFAPEYGNTANTICQGNDARLAGGGTVAAHATSHRAGGTDTIKLDALAAPDDITTLNSTSSAHGLLPKLSGNASQVFLGNGTWGSAGATSTLAAGIVSVTEYGALGNSTGSGSTGADDTDAFQDAVATCIANGKALFIPPGIYRLTEPITLTSRILIFGVGCAPYLAGITGSAGTGSWLYFAHTGIGIFVGDQGGAITSGVVLRDFGTRRAQPAPAPGWVPTEHDFDISLWNTDVIIQNVVLWNATRGVRLQKGNAGRVCIDNLRGHVFRYGIVIEESYDVPRITNVHFWPFWWNDFSYIHTYTRANLVGILVYRSDGLFINNLFVIFARAALQFSTNAYGSHLRGLYTNIYADLSAHGILIGAEVAGNLTFQASNVVCFGAWPEDTTGVPIRVSGSNCRIDLGIVEASNAPLFAILVEGTGNKVSIGHLRSDGWNKTSGGFAAVYVGAGNTVTFGREPTLENGNGGAVKSGAGSATKPSVVSL